MHSSYLTLFNKSVKIIVRVKNRKIKKPQREGVPPWLHCVPVKFLQAHRHEQAVDVHGLETNRLAFIFLEFQGQFPIIGDYV